MTRTVWREMTPARVREHAGRDYVDVAFLESARLYKLFRSHPRMTEAVDRLREAISTGRVVQVRLASLDSDVIEEVTTGARTA
jgi:hypothetical protein